MMTVALGWTCSRSHFVRRGFLLRFTVSRPLRCTAYVDAAYCYNGVTWSVCLTVTIVSFATMAEPIEMPFGV